jgi:hypothetical protein
MTTCALTNLARSIPLVICVSSLATIASSAELALESKDHGPEPAAKRILDEARPAAEREKLAAEHPAADTANLIAAMAEGLEMQPDLKEEYRRIPWIWRVAVAAGKRNQPDELARILLGALPRTGEKLRDWQAVVIGGGIINGIGLAGGWPAERISSIVSGHQHLRARWEQVQEQAALMADDDKVFKGTRYDAIRILGVGTWDQRGGQVYRYLLKGVDDELQMGAVSALGDMRSPSIGQALLSGFMHYSEPNRNMALDALLRDDSRIAALLDAVEDGRVAKSVLGEKRIGTLRKVADPKLKARVEKIIGTS